MIKRRTLLKISLTLPLLGLGKSRIFANERTIVLKKIKSFNELKKYPATEINSLIELSSYHEDSGIGGGMFIALKNDAIFHNDKACVADISSKLSWVRLESLNGIKKPEWYGCVGDGITDDSDAFNSMLDSLHEGDTIVLGESRHYHNKLPKRDSRWIIKKSNVTIIGNDSILSRRATSQETMNIDGANLATLQISNVTNFEIRGKLLITSFENKSPLADKNGKIISNQTYPRAYVSSHGLFLEKVNKAILPTTLTCSNAVFPCYITESSNINISGTYINSGQVYPVRGDDLQIGSGLKISKSDGFTVNVLCKDCAYCGCEIEPYSKNGTVNINSVNTFMHGCIIHQNGENIQANILSKNAQGAGLRISSGSNKIKAIIKTIQSSYGCIIVSEHDNICEELDLNLTVIDVTKDYISAININDNYPSFKNSNIYITEQKSNNPQLLMATPKQETAIKINNAQKSNIYLTVSQYTKNIDFTNSSNCTLKINNNKSDMKMKVNVSNNYNVRVLHNDDSTQ